METKETVGAKETEHKGLGRHGLIMLLCCLIPLAILGILWAVGVPGSYLLWGVLLLCPILHIVMMRGAGKDGHQH